MRRLSKFFGFGKSVGKPEDVSQKDDSEGDKPQKPSKAVKVHKPHIHTDSKHNASHSAATHHSHASGSDAKKHAVQSVETARTEDEKRPTSVSNPPPQAHTHPQVHTLASPQRIELDPLRVSLLLQLLHHLVKSVVEQHISINNDSAVAGGYICVCVCVYVCVCVCEERG